MRILLTLAAGVCLVGGLAAAWWLLVTGSHAGLAMLVGTAGFGGFLWLSRFDDRLKRKTDSDRASHADQRFTQLVALARNHDFELKVKGSSNMLLALFALALGSVAFFPEADWIDRVVAWGIVIPFGILMLLLAVPRVGKPVIVLTRSGFRTATSRDIPWRMVDGVDYRERTLSPNDSGAAPIGILTFSIPTLAQEIKRFSLVFRLLHGLRGQRMRASTIITLSKTSEPPSAVGRLAEHLWTQSTGRINDWNPHMSDAYNAANRELAELIAAHKKRPANSEPDLEELKVQVETAERLSRTLSSELDRKSRKLKLAVWVPVWLLVVVAVVMLVVSLK